MEGVVTICVICYERKKCGGNLCTVCGKSYDRNAHNEGTVLEAMVWAAKRARWFERKRQRELVRR